MHSIGCYAYFISYFPTESFADFRLLEERLGARGTWRRFDARGRDATFGLISGRNINDASQLHYIFLTNGIAVLQLTCGVATSKGNLFRRDFEPSGIDWWGLHR